jgi:hypothetical protein
MFCRKHETRFKEGEEEMQLTAFSTPIIFTLLLNVFYIIFCELLLSQKKYVRFVADKRPLDV